VRIGGPKCGRQALLKTGKTTVCLRPRVFTSFGDTETIGKKSYFVKGNNEKEKIQQQRSKIEKSSN